MVLFGGTSCQVNALYSYLLGTNTEKLFTIDLICHGVPSVDFFNEYVRHLEEKLNGIISNIKFRTKKGKGIRYELSFSLKREGKCEERAVTIPLKKSSYYRMFMGAESYQQACYSCPYASKEKPADITAGDYFEIRDDYPELLDSPNNLNIDMGVSSVIVHNEKGLRLLDQIKDQLYCKEVDLEKVIRSHSQLQRPSAYNKRYKLLEIYKKKGFVGLDRYYRKNDLFDWKENISIIIGRNNIKRIKQILKGK
jgi:coenzyme F420-reducing hydrogenase beta subunit